MSQTTSLQIAPPEISLQVRPDEAYLYHAWDVARASFLDYILNRRGQDKLRRNTRNNYEVALRQFFDGLPPVWPPIPPWLTTATLANQWFQKLSQAGKPIIENGVEVDRTGLSPRNVNLKLAAMRTFFDYVRQKFEIPYTPDQDPYLDSDLLFLSEDRRNVLLWSPAWRNPFDPKVVERLAVSQTARYPTTEDVAAILAQIDTTILVGKRDYALLLTLFSTACRSEEVLNLHWGDLQPIPNGNYSFYFWGKNGQYQGVELQKEAHQVICDYLAAAGRLDSMDDDDYVFAPLFPNRAKRLMPGYSGDANRPLSNDWANKIIKNYARRAGVNLDLAHLHGLRHARARHTIEAMLEKHGVADVMVVNRLLRHSNLAVTQRYIESLDDLPEDVWANEAIKAVRKNGTH